MKTAVVILNYNGKDFLEKFLPTVLEYSKAPDVSIYVADNASNDNSASLVSQKFPQVKVILLPENYGFAGGYNKALAEVDAEYYILLNSDVEVSANWINPMIDYLDSHSEFAACQPKILAYNNKSFFEYAGAAGGYIDALGYPFCRGRILGECEQDKGQYDTIQEIFWASGACLCIRKKDFWEVGGFDDSFFAHMEEIDLCWRLNARARKIACIPQSTVYHVGGGTLSVENPKKTYLNYRNNLLMIYKNMPVKSLRKVLLVRFVLDYLAAFQLLLSGKIANAKIVLKARRDFNERKIVYKHRREDNLRNTVIDYPSGMFKGSIIYQFYIKNKKQFNTIDFK